MYTPRYFEVPAQQTLLSILPEASFAVLVTPVDTGVEITHLPLSYDPEAGEQGTIYGHMAKPNPHSKALESGVSTVIFSGPHIYVSPTDYASNANVPTWNYVAVHATGHAKVIGEPEKVREILEQLTRENEESRSVPWTLDDYDQKKLQAMMRGIVAFEIPVEDLQAKAKLGQNKSREDRLALSDAASGTDLQDWQKSILEKE
ncbi:MAG: FMN-binding negative transcriptional regulator [Sneathiellales bacterium]|nr:FMN-binding negative transcriptional regulator [Sneathiellales bacterium]